VSPGQFAIARGHHWRPYDPQAAAPRFPAARRFRSDYRPVSASIATLSGSVRSTMIHLMSEKAPRRGRISAGRKARALWEDPPAELLFRVVTTETQLDINVDKLLLKHGASLASLPSAGRSPEPSAWATMLIGLGGLAFAGHRRVLEPRAAVSLVSRGVISTRPHWPASPNRFENESN
jgi:hypothetical protein